MGSRSGKSWSVVRGRIVDHGSECEVRIDEVIATDICAACAQQLASRPGWLALPPGFELTVSDPERRLGVSPLLFLSLLANDLCSQL